MKSAHLVKLSVFSKEEDSEADVLKSFLSLVPFNLEEEKLQLKTSTAEGFEHKKIRVFELTLTKEKHTTKFLESLISRLNDDQKRLILNQAESRLDEDLNFFMRLDKDKLLEKNEYFITQSGNCFHLKMHIASFPAKRQNAMEVLRGFLGKTISSQQLF